MKTDAISKINTIGRVGNIITIIARVLASLVLVLAIAATIFFAAVPNDFLRLNVAGDATIDLNLASIGVNLSEEDQTEIQDNLTKGTLEINAGPGTSHFETSNAIVDENGFKLQANGVIMNFSLHNVFLPLLAGCLYIVMTIVTLCFIGSLCKAFSVCQSPFESNVIIKMKHLAFSLIPWVVLSSITKGLMSGFMTGQFNLNAGINLQTILVIALIFGLTYIFQYGAVLQQESDETL